MSIPDRKHFPDNSGVWNNLQYDIEYQFYHLWYNIVYARFYSFIPSMLPFPPSPS